LRSLELYWHRQRREIFTLEKDRLKLCTFDDASFDLVISDGVLNLVPDKDAAFKQIVRVLWPGEDLMAQTLLSLKASRPILWRAWMRGLLELRVPCRVSLTWPSSRRLVFSPPKSG
jgi:ubiquinone/menaquinone biosynthesis C-methylase UbiE